MSKKVNIIGAGLAGCEAAWKLANLGVEVNLYEKKIHTKNSIQKLDGFAELVCSNTLRSKDVNNAVGLLKLEMEKLDSLIISAAKQAEIPSGSSLAVDKENFSNYITDKIRNHKNINIIEEEAKKINLDEVNIISSGPLTSDSLKTQIQNLLGEDYFFFYDAVAPLIELNSIDMNIAFRKNRYDKGETKDYINCPMNEDEYNIFYNELINAELNVQHLEDEKNFKVFEGCMPLEEMAKRNKKALTFGPMKPIGLNEKWTDRYYAVVQLRQDNAINTLYNLVGFQTNLKWSEQKRVFRLIPGLKNANFIRYGVMHKNSFINTPQVLNEFLQLKSNKNIFFAGQITGVEGYVESASTGIVTAINVYRYLNNKEMIKFPNSTVIGSLLNYINKSDPKNFQPMKANWGIVDVTINQNVKITKLNKKEIYSEATLKSFNDFMKTIGEHNE